MRYISWIMLGTVSYSRVIYNRQNNNEIILRGQSQTPSEWCRIVTYGVVPNRSSTHLKSPLTRSRFHNSVVSNVYDILLKGVRGFKSRMFRLIFYKTWFVYQPILYLVLISTRHYKFYRSRNENTDQPLCLRFFLPFHRVTYVCNENHEKKKHPQD